ncbi:FKBP-type peptidyl-prolyl cis-trans isomerase [Thalassobellus sediminis]|uniref:FKBP-type peptidyl-prolyl cis-trans isomerase n=1 Tax=Thalassobellus sediminis TaxID=3367753 RepID=UPI0037A363AC
MKTIKILSIVFVAAIMSSCNNKSITNKPLKTEIDSVSYAIGLDVAKNISATASEINKDILIQGLVDASDSTALKIDKDNVQQIISSYFQKKQVADREKQEAEAAAKAEKEFAHVKAEGEKFLEANMTKDGVEITESGLQYIVLKEGAGNKPTAASTVKVHYHGTLTDGTVFDSSVERGSPAQFGVGQVIKGWTEGLQLMSVGSKYKFFIPQELAYGATPRGGKIKPFSALVFEVELLEIVK